MKPKLFTLLEPSRPIFLNSFGQKRFFPHVSSCIVLLILLPILLTSSINYLTPKNDPAFAFFAISLAKAAGCEWQRFSRGSAALCLNRSKALYKNITIHVGQRWLLTISPFSTPWVYISGELKSLGVGPPAGSPHEPAGSPRWTPSPYGFLVR